MKATFLRAAAALAFVTVGQAATPPALDEPAPHQPAVPASAANVDTAKVDQQMMVMQGIHEKMMAAKTSEERAGLMQEHSKAMQDGMAMMGQMRASMGGDMAMGNSTDKAIPMTHDMMQDRLDKMETIIQLMTKDPQGDAGARQVGRPAP